MLRFLTAPLQLPFIQGLFYSAPLYSAFDLCYSVLQRLYTASLYSTFTAFYSASLQKLALQRRVA